MIGHLLLDAVGAEALGRAADVEARLVDGIAERLAGVTEHDERSGLRHEGRHVADRALHDDIDALHRNAAARRGVTVDDQQPATPGGAGRLAGVAGHADLTRHHVLGEPDAGIALHDDGRRLVHAGAVVPDMPLDLDGHGHLETNGDGMLSARIEHRPGGLVGVGGKIMQRLVQVPDARLGEIDNGHQRRSQK